jgi:hypothetical protein
MSYWAQLDNDNKVLQVTVGDDDLEDAYEWLVANMGGRWVQTTEQNYAGIGWTYVEDLGFHSPQPFASWTLNGLVWEAPTPKPEGDYYWDEAELEWKLVELS